MTSTRVFDRACARSRSATAAWCWVGESTDNRASPPAIRRYRRDPGWPSRTALAPAWVREIRSVEALPVGVERFTALSTPTLLITGEETESHHAQAITALHAVLPRSEITTLRGRGHTALILAPDQLSTSVLDYLNRH